MKKGKNRTLLLQTSSTSHNFKMKMKVTILKMINLFLNKKYRRLLNNINN